MYKPLNLWQNPKTEPNKTLGFIQEASHKALDAFHFFILRSEIVTMSRPMLLVFLLLILIITSQFEWREQLVSDVDSSPAMSQKQQQISKREEAVKEKIILAQEKNIQRLTELVRSLKEQLRQCRGNETMNGTLTSLAESVIELERQQILED